MPRSPSGDWPGTGLLRPWSDDFAQFDHDLFERYGAVARRLNSLLSYSAGPGDMSLRSAPISRDGRGPSEGGPSPKPFRILEIGCNCHNVLGELLDATKALVTRCDVEPVSDGPDFIVIPRDPPMPFADEEFDAVVALEVLEHITAEKRPYFIRECIRVARHVVILTCPCNDPEVVKNEALAAAAYEHRNGVDHPFLAEHREFGLPNAEDITAELRNADTEC